MAGVRCTELPSRPMECLDFTRVTLDECQPLVPLFDAAFQVRMAAWRMDGQPRSARRFSVDKHCPLPPPEERLFFLLTSLKTATLQVVQGRLCGMVQGKAKQWMHVLGPALRAARRAFGDAPPRSLTALAQRLGVSAADAATVGTPLAAAAAPLAAAPALSGSPLVPMTARRLVRPHGPAAQTDCDSGKTKDHPVQHVLLVHAPRTILWLSETYGGRVHAKRSAAAPPSPWPAGSRLWQDLGCLACTLPPVDILLPTKQPRGQELTREQDMANQALHARRLRIEQVHRSGKRCRMVKDRIRVWTEGVRDVVMELCWALPTFRVRLTPWQPMV